MTCKRVAWVCQHRLIELLVRSCRFLICSRDGLSRNLLYSACEVVFQTLTYETFKHLNSSSTPPAAALPGIDPGQVVQTQYMENLSTKSAIISSDQLCQRRILRLHYSQHVSSHEVRRRTDCIAYQPPKSSNHVVSSCLVILQELTWNWTII